MIAEGSKAPDFSLLGSDGKQHSLADFKGRYVVLYFYPKDDTPGCTIEAKGFNNRKEEIKRLGAEIVGVSADDINSHNKFCSKYGLEFLLLSDPESKVIKQYDAFGDKGIFGKGTLRKTFIIDGQGVVVKVFNKVNALGHDKEVVEYLASK